MICDDCGKNEAVVHITQIGPEGKIDKNLCKLCAERYGSFIAQENKDDSVNDFLKGIFSNAKEAEQNTQEPAAHCPACGMSLGDFLRSGKIGCSECYKSFHDQLEPLIRRIHGSSTHNGKIPHRTGGLLELKNNVKRLRSALETCVANEEYEKAAEYRDRIRALEKQLAESDSRGGGDNGNK